MRVSSIDLSWFRGAGESITLNTNLKSVVVYGANGSGKSSFADALEYIVMKGKIGHLKHEYSGSKQEKGVINTHRPDGWNSTIVLSLDGKMKLAVKIAQDGTPTFSSTPSDFVDFVQSWQLERLLLRQDEVANFITDTKGHKYSVLLPLLGLDNLETAADNVSKLKKHINDLSEVLSKKIELQQKKKNVERYLSGVADDVAYSALRAIATKYDIDTDRISGHDQLLNSVQTSVKARIDSMTPEIVRHTLLKKIHEQNLQNMLSDAIEKRNIIRDKIDELLNTRIQILQSAQKYNDNLKEDAEDIQCPACGISIAKAEFETHVKSELAKLQELCSARDSAGQALQNLRNSITQTLTDFNDENLQQWLKEEPQTELKTSIEKLSNLNKRAWHDKFTIEDQGILSQAVQLISEAAKIAVARIPPSSNQLIQDMNEVEAIKTIPEIRKLEADISLAGDIVRSLDSMESAIRKNIRAKTEQVIASISKDVQFLWTKLHPQQPIENIRLYLPPDVDKSLDIALKFHGVEQPSPRLTLSEGHRNSLGLCIFLALARLEKNRQTPIFLDDIVSSLDRGHRGNVTDLLLNHMKERQILLFTHDREWFQELRVLLPGDSWKMMVLKPWDTPSIGMQWSASENTFDDARNLMKQSCESAGNCVRGIMDTQLAIAAEKLRLNMPYARGDRNDHRTCVEFLECIISQANNCLRKKEGPKWVKYNEPIEYWQNARNLLIARGDRASHSGSIVSDEVENLIQHCDLALGKLKCSDCGKYIWTANQENKQILQCGCGSIQWRYG
jgi:energy-coupling factor transporter ATP-binding protein EcfA2